MYDKGLLVISEASPWISKLLQEFHSNPTRRHSGAFHTYRRLAATLYWRNMMRSAQQYLAACLLSASTIWGCFSHRPSPTIASSRFDLGRYSHGFYHSLTQVPRLDCILAVVDRLSKYAYFLPLKYHYIARSVAELFAREIVRLHGIPQSIVSDRDPAFVSSFWQELFKLQGTKLK